MMDQEGFLFFSPNEIGFIAGFVFKGLNMCFERFTATAMLTTD